MSSSADKTAGTYKVFHFLRRLQAVSQDDFKNALSAMKETLSTDNAASHFFTLAAGHQHENAYTPSDNPDYDAVLEIECESEGAAVDTQRSLHDGAIAAQLDPIIDNKHSPVVASRVFVMKDAPFAHIAQKMVCPINMRDGTTVEHFRDYWRNSHAKVAVEVLPIIHRYVQCHTVESEYEGGRAPVFDGIAEFWFEDLAQAMADAESTPEAAERNYKDQLNFMDTRDKLILIVEGAA